MQHPFGIEFSEGVCAMTEQLVNLALRRAGAATLADFQRENGLPQTGQTDEATEKRLLPLLLGYERHRVQRGDTLWTLARRYGTRVCAIETANPGVDASRLRIGQTLTVPLGFPVVPTDVPFPSELLALCVRGLTARYPAISSRPIAVTLRGKPVTLLKFGQGPRSVLYNASHHANEWITTPILLHFLEQYADAVSGGGTIFGRDARALFRRTQLYLVPMVNPDGVDLVTGALRPGDQFYRTAELIAAYYPAIRFPDGWKANLSGVDLNLNYPAEWEQAKKIKAAQGFDGPAPRDFVGEAPLDQPESRAMAALTRQVNPRLTLSYHSQGEEIYWKFLNFAPAGAQLIGEEFALVSGYALCDPAFQSSFAGYKDWFLQEFNRPAYTVEVGLGVNPLPITDFPSIYAKNLGILTLGLER